MNTQQLTYFIHEREAIRRRRAAGHPPPWTDDPILREWSFTNVHREDDRVTRWIAANWREPHAYDPDLWFAMCVARFVNWPDTLADVGFPVPWDPARFVKVMAARAARRDKVYGGAYMIRADNKNPGRPTAEYQVEEVFDPLWSARERLRPREVDTLASWFARLSGFHGMGAGFMAAQIVADMKNVWPLAATADCWTFAASGPGSRRGLNRILGRAVDAKWTECGYYGWRGEFARLREAIAPELARMGIWLDAQDLQNCLCEFDKYERVRLGEGKPRRRFRPDHRPPLALYIPARSSRVRLLAPMLPNLLRSHRSLRGRLLSKD
jgi:hypothetical protein